MPLRAIDNNRIRHGNFDAIADALNALTTSVAKLQDQAAGAIGRWQTVPYDEDDFTATGGIWDVGSADVLQFVWMRLGLTLVVHFTFNATSVGAGVTAYLKVRLPAGLKAAPTAVQVGVLYANDNGGAQEVGRILANGAGAEPEKLLLSRLNANWTASVTNGTTVIGCIVLQIAPPAGS